MSKLQELKEEILKAIKLSGQMSYERRAPRPEAVPLLMKARASLEELVHIGGKQPETFRLLSQVDECLLNYGSAIKYLEKAIASSDRKDKRDLKKLALLRGYKKKWSDLVLKPNDLKMLGIYLQEQLETKPCNHTYTLTIDWLNQHQFSDVQEILESFRNHGGNCDCEVLANIVR